MRLREWLLAVRLMQDGAKEVSVAVTERWTIKQTLDCGAIYYYKQLQDFDHTLIPRGLESTSTEAGFISSRH
jgi:hypothetical protein